jgi:uncharacterized protein YggE
MFASLQLSSVGRFLLGMAVFLALLAAAALMVARALGAGERNGVGMGLPGLAAGAALAQDFRPPPGEGASGLVVFGDGEASGAPDIATVTLGVQSEGRTAREAIDQNSAAMAAVIDALKRLGVPERNLRTAEFSLSEIRAPSRQGDQSPPIVGYRAHSSLHVTVEPVARAGEAIDAAVGAGANVAGGVRFAISDDSELRRRALDQAGKAARAKAEALAASLGVRLGTIQAVVEEGADGGPVVRAESAPADARGAGPPVQPGELTLRVRVRVVFAIA